MTSIYSVILSILKRGLALSLGAAGVALFAYSVYSLKKTETQALRFVTNHVAALAEAGVNSQNVNEIDKEIARFTQTWKETQDLDLRVDISLDGKLISHAGQLQPFGIFHSRVQETTPLPSGQMLSIIVEVSLASFIQSGILLLASIALFIGCVFLVLMWLMRRMTVDSVIGPLESRIKWLKFVATCGGGGTLGDDSFMAKARESKPAVIVATQSLSSLMNTVGRERPALELVQNFRTRVACHSSDLETIKMFQALAGKEDVESQTHSFSETAQSAKLNLLAGGFDSKNSSLNEAVSRGTRREDILTGKEFSRLRTFEAFAQVFDGIETKFLKLYLKPDFLKAVNTKHETVLEMLRVTKKGGILAWLKSFSRNSRAVAASLLLAGNVQAAGIPNVCSVASSPAFSSCLELTVSGCTCGYRSGRR